MAPTDDDVSRREFHRWMLTAAWGGALVGAAGCQPAAAPPATSGGSGSPASAAGKGKAEVAAVFPLTEPHVCRGLNTCKGLGRSGDNKCAGQGTCASVKDTMCGGHNECKGQGGCGTDPGMNACKGQGGCHVPLMSSVWPTARQAFEKAMKSAGKEFGAAPAKAKAKGAAEPAHDHADEKH